MISDDEFTEWLNHPTSVHCILIEADYYDEGAEVYGTAYLSTLPFVSRPSDAPPDQTYYARIESIPEFAQQMTEAFIGRTTANIGKVCCINTGALDGWLFHRDWIGYGLRAKVGDPSWPLADFRNVWTGVIADIEVAETNRFSLIARDMQHLLNQPLIRDVFATTTLVGQPQPLGFGTIYNARLIPLEPDGGKYKYRVAEGPIANVLAVRDNGSNTSFTADLAAGTVTLTGASGHEYTCDYVGPTVGTLDMTNAADLIRYFAVTRGYFRNEDIDDASFARLRASFVAPLAFYAPAANMQVYEAIDQVCATFGGYTAVDRDGKFYVGRVTLTGDPIAEITPEKIVQGGLGVARMIQPVDRIRLGARQNQAVNIPQPAVGVADQMKYKQSSWQCGEAQMINLRAPKLGRLITPPTLPPSVVDVATNPDLMPTLFANGADAAIEAERRMEIWGRRRFIVRCTCYMSALRLKLGDIVRITHPRYGMADGKQGQIVALKERLSSRRVELGILV